MSGISESGGVPRLLGVVPAVAGPKSVPAPSTEVRLIGPPSSDVLISEAPRSEFRLLEPPSTGARLSEPPRSEYRLIEAPASEVRLSEPPRSEFRLIGAPTSEVTLSGPQALPAAPAISTGEDRVPVIGGGAPERNSVIQPPDASAIHDHGLPYSGFDRLQDAVNAARYPDGSPLSAAHKKAIYDYYGLASEGLSDAGADAIADQLAILVRNRKNLMGTELNGNAYRPDADGAMVFDHLASFIRSPLNAAFEKTGKPELARQLLERITSPEKTHQGQDTLDCTLATLEGELAFTRPADFARIAVGLITRGEATLTDGTSMPLATFDPATAGGRSLIDMAVQSSMGALAAGTTHWDGQTTIAPPGHLVPVEPGRQPGGRRHLEVHGERYRWYSEGHDAHARRIAACHVAL